jgi:hypothetical protein
VESVRIRATLIGTPDVGVTRKELLTEAPMVTQLDMAGPRPGHPARQRTAGDLREHYEGAVGPVRARVRRTRRRQHKHTHLVACLHANLVLRYGECRAGLHKSADAVDPR